MYSYMVMRCSPVLAFTAHIRVCLVIDGRRNGAKDAVLLSSALECQFIEAHKFEREREREHHQ